MASHISHKTPIPIRGAMYNLQLGFRIADGTPTDPTGPTFKMLEPAGTVTTYVYPTNAQLVRDSAGVFHVDWIPDEHGTHTYRFIGTGAVQSAAEDSFLVRQSAFA